MKKTKWILLTALTALVVLFAACDYASEEPEPPYVPTAEDVTISGDDLSTDFLITGDNGFIVDLPELLDISKYSSVAVKVQIYAGETAIDGADGNALFKLLNKAAASASWDNDEIIHHYNLKTGTNTEAVPSSATGVPLSLVVVVLQPESGITKVVIESITFKAKTSDATFSGSGSFWNNEAVTQEILATYQGKNDVFKVSASTYDAWAPVRVDLTDYAEKTVTVTLSVKVWMDQASKIMFQTNNSSYTVIAGGNDSYNANEWVEFTGSKEVTLPESVEGTSTPWFYLDNAGLKPGATYYFADFTLNVEE